MDRFRAYLGEGFMTHLEENKNLMYIFDYYIDIKAPVVATMTKQERVRCEREKAEGGGERVSGRKEPKPVLWRTASLKST
jgi:hypothetical protein